MKTRRFFVVILAILLLLTALTACGGNDSEGNTSTTTLASTSDVVAGNESLASETTGVTEANQAQLTIVKEDHGGQVINILQPTHAQYEYFAKEETGDLINDAVYARNLAVEELLGVTFNIITEDGHWAQRVAFNNLISNSVLAEDGAFDLISGVAVVVLPTAADGLFINTLELNHIDFSNPWWVQNMEEDLAIDGKLFGCIGDASLSLYKDLSVVYFNEELIKTLGQDNPYELVRNNSWTIDKLFEMVSAGASDLNGDGSISQKEDQLAYIAHKVSQRTFQTATEMKVFSFDADGKPQVPTPDERTIDIFNRIVGALYQKDTVHIVDATDQAAFTSIFAENRALFMVDFLYGTEYLRDMEIDYGIVPIPKADSTQESYHTQIGTSTSMFFVPRTVKNTDLIGKICESLCYYSWRDVVPAYYEVALKYKYTRNPDMQEMLDIIRETAQMDFTFAYSTIYPAPYPNQLVECTSTAKVGENLTSFIARVSGVWQKYTEKLFDKYAALD